MVVVLHAADRTGLTFNKGHYGVDLFFVVSGIVIYLASARKRKSAVRFLAERLMRVAVPYYVALTIIVFDIKLFGTTYSGGPVDPLGFISDVLFQFRTGINGVFVLPIYPVGWTLNYEMFFYALFAVAIGINYRYRALFCAIVILTLSATQIVLREQTGFWYMQQTKTAVEFTYGLGLAWIYLRLDPLRRKRRAAALLALGLFTVAGAGFALAPEVSAYSGHRFLSVGVPAAAALAACLILERAALVPKVRILSAMGGASYSLYLVHLLVINKVALVTDQWSPDGKIGAVAVMIGVSLIIAWIFHIWIERPALRLSHLIMNKRPTAAHAP